MSRLGLSVLSFIVAHVLKDTTSILVLAGRSSNCYNKRKYLNNRLFKKVNEGVSWLRRTYQKFTVRSQPQFYDFTSHIQLRHSTVWTNLRPIAVTSLVTSHWVVGHHESLLRHANLLDNRFMVLSANDL